MDEVAAVKIRAYFPEVVCKYKITAVFLEKPVSDIYKLIVRHAA